jgi:hypothetical protein
MSTALPPIDESVKLPDSVLRAARAAEVIHKANYPDAAPLPAPVPAQVHPAAAQPAIQDGDRPINIVAAATSDLPQPAIQPAPAVQPDPAQVQPQPDPAQPAAPLQPDNWEHRYLSMKGRYDQSQSTMAGMQEQMAEMGNELSRMTAMLNSGQRPQEPTPASLVTDKDVETYGPELVDFTRRAAQAAVAPKITAIQQENQRLRQALQRQGATHVYGELDTAIPNWREINTDPRFVQYLRLRDVYSGEVRGRLLRAAFAAADAPRILAFFNGFLREEQATGQRPAPQPLPAANTAPRVAAVPLETLAAPGVRPATDLQQPADKPIFTHRQIAEFYSHQGRARYVGRDEDRRKDELEIFAAQREGRIR